MLTAIVAAGCAGSDAAAPADTLETETDVDLVEGAFERNDGSKSDGTSSPPGSDPATSLLTETAGGDATSTTVGDATAGGSTTEGETTETNGGDADSGPTTGGSGSTGTTDGAVAPSVEPGQGVIVVGGVEYLFPTATCEFDAESALVEGEGISSEFGQFTASIFYELEDFDADGQVDLTLDVFIDFEPPADGNIDDLPELYASKVDTGDFDSGTDINVTVEGTRIFGDGLMTDFNSVVFPIDETGPMAFDARCS